MPERSYRGRSDRRNPTGHVVREAGHPGAVPQNDGHCPHRRTFNGNRKMGGITYNAYYCEMCKDTVWERDEKKK